MNVPIIQRSQTLKVTADDFKKQLRQYIQFRGIDIVLYLKDGSMVELDKNRRLEGDMVIRNQKDGNTDSIHVDEIIKADFFAA
ncbi:MAG: hypothetical protein CMF59_16855 [Leptospiraceae bacterium]|nr:hypothetical protein [Leptospiraceae bacterium]